MTDTSTDTAAEAPPSTPPPDRDVHVRRERDLVERFRRAQPTRLARDTRDNATRRNFDVRGESNAAWRDVYHNLLTMRWWAFVLTVAVVYTAANLVFALLYWPDTAGLNGARPNSFVDALNFSVETLGTIGYGAMSPRDGYANALVATEAFTSIFLTAVLTGLIFARVSRPSARILFSERAVVAPFEGRPTLMLRAANQRGNQILEAEATLSFASQVVTEEGAAMRVFTPMALRRARSPLFAISWTIMHTIDESSPLHGRDLAWMRERGGELVVTVAGVDETSAQRVHARTSYVADEIAWGMYFVDIITPPAPGGTGRWVIDYTRFHDVRPPRGGGLGGAGEA